MHRAREVHLSVRRTTSDDMRLGRAAALPGIVLLTVLLALPASAQQEGNARVWTSKSNYEVNETIVVHFSGLPGNQSDWIAVRPEGSPDDSWDVWRYTEGKVAGQMEFAGMQEGRYQVRLYFDWAGTQSYQVRYRHNFVVGLGRATPTQEPQPPGGVREGGGLICTGQDVYEPDAPITVHFAGLPGNTSDWINVVAVDEPDDAWSRWRYTDGKSEGTLEFAGLPRGRYQVRVYFNWAGTRSYQVQDRHSFFVGDPPPHFEGLAITERERYAPGETITVFYAGLPGNASDWIAIAPAGAPDTTWGQWRYTRGRTNGILEFPPHEPGRYEVRVYFDWEGTHALDVQYRHQFRVEHGGPG